MKFKGSFANDTRSFDSDVPVYRLAEAYLLKAEVENALGNTDAALQNLNVVAKRAYGVDNYYTARTRGCHRQCHYQRNTERVCRRIKSMVGIPSL
ncbi:RagB/SusD family nutrient uptake outer membrane protein [Bacteroides uniformis]|nr:RagB/SusD family nutrient uptake outer membrane protein [Bacteroides uniformis]